MQRMQPKPRKPIKTLKERFSSFDAELMDEAIKDVYTLANTGMDIKTLYYEKAYIDSPESCLAFLVFLEDRLGVKVDSAAKLREATDITQDMADAERIFNMAYEQIYYLTIVALIENGGMYEDLLKIDHHLPEVWNGLSDNTTKPQLLNRTLRAYFNLGCPYTSPPIEGVAAMIGAPYLVILEASEFT